MKGKVNIMNNNYIERFLERTTSNNTKETYRYALTQMLEYVDKPESEITYGDLVDYKEHFSKQYSTGTMALKIRCMRSYFNYLYFDAELISQNPTVNKRGRSIKENKIQKKQETYYTMDDVKLMIEHSNKARDRAIIAVLMTIGLRVSELINLTLSDYSNDNKTATIITKGNKKRKIIFNPICQEYVDEYLKVRPAVSDDNLFISNQGNKMSRNCINLMLKKCAKMAGLPTDIHAHSLRHTVISEVLQKKDLETARQFIGHASANTTLNYTHTTNTRVRDVAMSIGM